jgi:hypothetical protein
LPELEALDGLLSGRGAAVTVILVFGSATGATNEVDASANYGDNGERSHCNYGNS